MLLTAEKVTRGVIIPGATVSSTETQQHAKGHYVIYLNVCE